MSSKPSTSKRDYRLPKPELMLTRHKSNLLKRQLRNKDDSIKRISQITQMLKSPNSKDKSPKPQTKSPSKKKVIKFKQKIDKLVQDKMQNRSLLKTQQDLKLAHRRKTAAPQRGSKPRPLSPTVEQLVLEAERRLDDEDLLEILTCASPVWWEHPPSHHYIEDPIYTLSPSDMEYEDITKNTNEESNPVPEAAMSTIAIPPVKQTDDKFMKKRNKLENLLGNIRNKICHSDVTPKSDENNEDKDKGNVKSDIENNAETKSDKVCKVTKGNDVKSDTDNRITVCTTVKDSKHTNERLPEEKVNEKEIKTNETEDEEKEEGTKKEDGSKEESRDAREATTSESTEEDVFLNLQNEEFLRDLENIDIPIEEEKSADSVEDLDSQDSFLELNRIVIEENKNPLASEKVVEHTASEKYTTPLKIDNANEDSNIKRVKKRPLSDPDIPQRDAIKIYFVDAVANTENAELTTKISKISTLSITEKDRLSSTSVDGSKDATNDNTKVNEHDTTVTDTKVSFKEDETASIKLNPEIVVKSESNEVNMKDPNEFADKATNMTSKNKDLDRDIAINDCIVTNVEEKAFFRKVKDESNSPDNNQSNNNKNLNKEQLLAVYKIITDNNYREKYIKTIKDGDETEHHNKTKSNDRLNKDTLEFYFKKYKSAQKRDKQKQEIQTLNKNEIEATKPKPTQDGSKNEVSENCKRETCLSIISDVKSVKYCLKCSSIFETDACDYCNRENLATPQGTLADTMTKHCKSCVRNGINIGTT